MKNKKLMARLLHTLAVHQLGKEHRDKRTAMVDPRKIAFLCRKRVVEGGSPGSEARRNNQMSSVAMIYDDGKMSLYQASQMMGLAATRPHFRRPGDDHRVSPNSCGGWATGVSL
jgi:hypothetical protein